MVHIEYSSIVLVANYCRVPALISICNGMYTGTMLIMTVSLSATITHDTGFGLGCSGRKGEAKECQDDVSASFEGQARCSIKQEWHYCFIVASFSPSSQVYHNQDARRVTLACGTVVKPGMTLL